jgi:hypothetical protein
MNKRKLKILAELVGTIGEFLADVEESELNPDLLEKAQSLRPIVEGFGDLIEQEIE